MLVLMQLMSAEYLSPSIFGRVVLGFERRLLQQGLSIEYGADFDLFESLLSDTEKVRLTEHFRIDLNTYSPANAFWVRVINSSMETVAVCAARLDLLGTETLDVHLAKYWKRCYSGKGAESLRLAQRQPRFMREVSGSVAYFGELWVSPDWRGQGIHASLAPLAMTVALQKWNPDWMYCWVRPSAWSKRHPLAYGFSAVHPVGIRWENEPETIDDDLVVALNKREWALDWVDSFAEKFPLE